jgi:hypothetical protein
LLQHHALQQWLGPRLQLLGHRRHPSLLLLLLLGHTRQRQGARLHLLLTQATLLLLAQRLWPQLLLL